MKSIVVMLFAASLTGALVACQGGRVAPAAPSSLPLARAAQPSLATGAPHGHAPSCALRRALLPGRYVLLESEGNVARNVYTAIDGSWVDANVSAGPTPPGGGPRTPTQPTYLYIGTYHLNRTKQTGCAYLETTVSGNPFLASTNNASIGGLPNITAANPAIQAIASGTLRIGPLRLSATAGRATFVLLQRGRIFDTGTLVLHKRIDRRGP